MRASTGAVASETRWCSSSKKAFGDKFWFVVSPGFRIVYIYKYFCLGGDMSFSCKRSNSVKSKLAGFALGITRPDPVEDSTVSNRSWLKVDPAERHMGQAEESSAHHANSYVFRFWMM